MATRRSFSGCAAVSSGNVIVVASVVVDQPVAEIRLAAREDVGERLPDCVGGRRAAGNEVVDLDHLVQRVHLVERQRQLGIVRNEPVGEAEARSGRPPAGSSASSRWLRCAGRPPLIAQAPMRDQLLAVRAELAQHVHVLRVAQAALDDADVAVADLLDVGERRAVEFDQLEQARTAARRCRETTCGNRSSRRARSSRP